MVSKVLFITKEGKFLYDGNIHDVKSVKNLDNVEIKFSRPMIVFDIDNVNLDYFITNYGNLQVGEYNLVNIVNFIVQHNYILFVDHSKKKITIYLNGANEISLPYEYLVLLRYLLAKTPSGILLESTDFITLYPF
jgi:hypothetical protein